MPDMYTVEELATLKAAIDSENDEVRDDNLYTFLLNSYPTQTSQNN